MADIIKEWKKHASGERTLVYACTIEHGEMLLARFLAAGIPAAFVHAGTEDGERKKLLGKRGALARGEILVVINVGIVTEGFDCPAVGCIVMARPTKSLVLYRQMCGRGARPLTGKKRYVLLDHAGNWWRHGAPDKPIEWSLDGRLKNDGPPPSKPCEACGRPIPIGCRECPECGAAQPLTERELAEQQAELERVREEQLTKEGFLRRIAQARGLDDAWVQRQLKAAS
jgi:DNA repair protein RadD